MPSSPNSKDSKNHKSGALQKRDQRVKLTVAMLGAKFTPERSVNLLNWISSFTIITSNQLPLLIQETEENIMTIEPLRSCCNLLNRLTARITHYSKDIIWKLNNNVSGCKTAQPKINGDSSKHWRSKITDTSTLISFKKP